MQVHYGTHFGTIQINRIKEMCWEMWYLLMNGKYALEYVFQLFKYLLSRLDGISRDSLKFFVEFKKKLWIRAKNGANFLFKIEVIIRFLMI